MAGQGSIKMLLAQLIPDPLIVIGMHRSGTSFLSRVLDEAGMFMGRDLSKENNESYFFEKENDELLRAHSATWYSPKPVSTSNDYHFPTLSFVRQYFGVFSDPRELGRAIRGGRWGWKDPRNTYTLPVWTALFPRCKIVHVVRNGMDVAISLWRRNSKYGESNKEEYRYYFSGFTNVLECFRLWEEYVAQGMKYHEVLEKRIITVRYEDLMRRNHVVLAELEAFLQLPLSDLIEARADSGRQKRFEEEGFEELRTCAERSAIMKDLGYL